MSEDIVEDVRLRDVIKRIRRADRHSGREATQRQRPEEVLRLEKSAHGHRAPSSARFETLVHLLEIWNAIARQPDHFDPVQERIGSTSTEMLHAAVKQRLPDAVVFVRVSRPILADIECFQSLNCVHIWLQKENGP